MCNAASSWEEVDTQYCLPMYPAEGKAFVDIDLYLTNGNTVQIKREGGEYIIKGLLNYYTMLDLNAITVHRVYAQDTVLLLLLYHIQYTSIQVRITTEATKADAIYKELQQEKSDEHVLTSLDDYIKRNRRNYYTTSGSDAKADFFVKEVNKREPKAANNLITVIVIVVVIILLIVGVIAGFFIWLQIKRNGPRNGSKQLKATSKV